MSMNERHPVFRFAPSPNGLLHLGHAYSALLNQKMAREKTGRVLLRIEDIDRTRCRPELEEFIYRDLVWLGFRWDGTVRRQSEHLADYASALQRLTDQGLIYPAFLTRSEVKQRVSAWEASGRIWPRDPDGAPHYPEDDRERSEAERRQLLALGKRHALRLDMAKAVRKLSGGLNWRETGESDTGIVEADPLEWGDVILSRSDAPSSYHLSVVVDDAAQGVTHVVRGLDLFKATAVHRLLQHLLDLPEPIYHHHRLILGPDGRKLSKSEQSTGLESLREAGQSPADIRRLLGLA
ncbi:tRNA glutamyl-Q(34) synthetase GluQRS [Rhizobium helianthi]|uniref:tRNA glutamyl-Q(34) synthetase GluQRS n=1 Tax=Rhizobium helianthi TaxID=1132695 RepID=A0ABW4M2K9_9HYPH